ncbi:hypothetical protein U6M47_12545, partial [Cutibacterium acnes]
ASTTALRLVDGHRSDAICAASADIAAEQANGGRTAHRDAYARAQHDCAPGRLRITATAVVHGRDVTRA